MNKLFLRATLLVALLVSASIILSNKEDDLKRMLTEYYPSNEYTNQESAEVVRSLIEQYTPKIVLNEFLSIFLKINIAINTNSDVFEKSKKICFDEMDNCQTQECRNAWNNKFERIRKEFDDLNDKNYEAMDSDINTLIKNFMNNNDVSSSDLDKFYNAYCN